MFTIIEEQGEGSESFVAITGFESRELAELAIDDYCLGQDGDGQNGALCHILTEEEYQESWAHRVDEVLVESADATKLVTREEANRQALQVLEESETP
jgi:hypothetical protein